MNAMKRHTSTRVYTAHSRHYCKQFAVTRDHLQPLLLQLSFSRTDTRLRGIISVVEPSIHASGRVHNEAEKERYSNRSEECGRWRNGDSTAQLHSLETRLVPLNGKMIHDCWPRK
ncbi:hypothetical protein ANTQUA_LOCUS6991 [Anthophora quadrimaculata]